MNRWLLTSPEVDTCCQKYPANAIDNCFFFFFLSRLPAHHGEEEEEASGWVLSPQRLPHQSSSGITNAISALFVLRCYWFKCPPVALACVYPWRTPSPPLISRALTYSQTNLPNRCVCVCVCVCLSGKHGWACRGFFFSFLFVFSAWKSTT